MEIVFEEVIKKDIFNNINITLKNDIYLLKGSFINEFYELLINEDYEGNIIDSDNYLNCIYYLNDYNSFITNNVNDELYLNIKNTDYEKNITKILSIFNLNKEFLNKSINTLSFYEKKIIRLIICYYNEASTIFIEDLFKGISYQYKKIFIKFLNSLKKHKLIFIIDEDDMLYISFNKALNLEKDVELIEDFKEYYSDKEKKPLIFKIENINDLKNIKDIVEDVKV